MATTFSMVARATAAAMVLVAAPAVAMPVAPQASQAAVIPVSGWAARAEGRRHTYPDAYSYGYGYRPGVYGGYGGWADDGYAEPYGGYGRGAPPPYDYGDDGYDD